MADTGSCNGERGGANSGNGGSSCGHGSRVPGVTEPVPAAAATAPAPLLAGWEGDTSEGAGRTGSVLHVADGAIPQWLAAVRFVPLEGAFA